MKHYLYLPFKKCKNCKHFDCSATRAYNCNTSADTCPAFKVQIVVKDSVVDLASRYKKAVTAFDLDSQALILAKVKSHGRAFEYKFKQEIKNDSTGKK